MQVTDWKTLEEIISKVFIDICGEFGKKTFFDTTVPNAKKVYGTNYSSAGIRLLDIIDEGADLGADMIDDYFAKAISKDELDYARKDKGEILHNLINTINKVITEEGKKHKDGVIAVILFGSFAKGNFHFRSDLDLTYVLGPNISNHDEAYYASEFDDKLNGLELTKRDIKHWERISISDTERITNLVGTKGSLMAGNDYIIITPDKEVAAKIDALLKKHTLVRNI